MSKNFISFVAEQKRKEIGFRKVRGRESAVLFSTWRKNSLSGFSWLTILPGLLFIIL